jgi:hypothetical protein
MAQFFMPRIVLGAELVECRARELRDRESILLSIPLDNAPDLDIIGTPAQLLTLAASMTVAVQEIAPDVEVVLIPIDDSTGEVA